MQKLVAILIFFLITASCCGTTNLKNFKWQIDSVTPASQLFREGMIVDFSRDKIRFSENGHSSVYPVIISDNRMVIETGYVKWLFEIKSSGSTMVLIELYTKKPIEIKLKKNQ